jgi:2-(1,2-epoxy-1,2-dihydrophenyl)acetyl-CoA isomerase
VAYETLLMEVRDHIATVTFNRPEQMNALDLTMRAELKSILADVADDRDIRVLVLTGTGKAFCAGGDIRTMEGETAPSGRDRMKKGSWQMTRLFASLEKPIIAAVNGVAAGAGFNIALAADMIIAAENARFQQSFVKIGLIPDLGGLYSLPLRIGLPRAKELMMTGRFIE